MIGAQQEGSPKEGLERSSGASSRELERSKCNTILVVEDDEAILFTLQELLESEGYSVRIARNGQEAIDALSKDFLRPCLVLLDLFMPVMDGWQFVDQLKLDRGDSPIHIPIVVTSAAGDRAAQAAKQVSGYIKKPIDLDLLLNTVKKFCG